MFVLVDVASTYVIGQSPASITDESPGVPAVEEMFQKGWEAKRSWPQMLFLPEGISQTNGFATVARRHGIQVHEVSEIELTPILSELRQSFNEHVRSATGDV